MGLKKALPNLLHTSASKKHDEDTALGLQRVRLFLSRASNDERPARVWRIRDEQGSAAVEREHFTEPVPCPALCNVRARR